MSHPIPDASKEEWTDEQILRLAVESGFTEGGVVCWGTEFITFARALLSATPAVSVSPLQELTDLAQEMGLYEAMPNPLIKP
jgi:hypothetical protein